MKKLREAIKFLENKVPNSSKGLPKELFYYLSRLTPLVNVDLLIKDEKGRMLLAWRDDIYCGRGWHIPGGIVRFQETLEERVRKVAQKEIGTDVDFNLTPLAVTQIIHPELKNRSHFISILFNCFLPSTFVPKNKGKNSQDQGYLKWHNSCPGNLIKYHKVYYKKYLSK